MTEQNQQSSSLAVTDWLSSAETGSQLVPCPDESRWLAETRIPGRYGQTVEALLEVPQESVSLTDYLGTLQLVKAPHRAEASCEMLMIPLDPLLLELPREVIHVRKHSVQSSGIE